MNKVAVYGGLGNQMFQYAFCTSLNEKGIKADLSFLCYLYYVHHTGFDLNRAFKLKLRWHKRLLAFFIEHGDIIYNNRVGRFFLWKFISFYERKRKFYREKTEFSFDGKVYEQSDVFFYGTWQSVKYFKHAATELKKKLTFKIPTDGKNKNSAFYINECNSVSIHVRRGDYLNSRWNGALNILEDGVYYKKAVKYMKEKVSNPHFFIFSDDIDWAKKNLELNECTYINFNAGKKSYADMYLMSICKHNIIANSSFSWWAAWLNPNKSKIVIMPDVWMKGSNCEGLYMEDEWIKMAI